MYILNVSDVKVYVCFYVNVSYILSEILVCIVWTIATDSMVQLAKPECPKVKYRYGSYMLHLSYKERSEFSNDKYRKEIFSSMRVLSVLPSAFIIFIVFSGSIT